MSATPHHAVLRIEYLGTNFHGWARQPSGFPTIEQAILDAFSAIACNDVHIRCAGRTDAGVHASAQVVDARYTGTIGPDSIGMALNTQLPNDVSVLGSTAAPDGFDARADATSRAYEYRVLTRSPSSPLRSARVLHHPRALDRDALDAAAALMLGKRDFTAFTPAKTSHVFFHRTVDVSEWNERGDELVYHVRANAFLRRMVRAMVGSMLAVGRGELALETLDAILDGAPRERACTTAPSNGLCLVDVTWHPLPSLPLPPDWRHGTNAATVPFSSNG